MAENLVSCEWLKGKLSEGKATSVVVVDVTWEPTKDCQPDYAKEHIPGAMYLNVLTGKHTELLMRNIPTLEQFQTSARAAGIDSTTHVVVYSSNDKCGFFYAGRGWWTFKLFGHSKVSILDGGLKKWKMQGLSTSAKPPATPKAGNFTAKWCPETYKQMDDVLENMSSKKYQLVDTRPNPGFAKEHVAGAKNIPMPSLIDEDKAQLKSPEELKKLFTNAGVDLTKPVMMYCNGGMSSCTLFLAATLCGNNSTAIYHGGITEWKIRQADKVEAST